MKRPVFWAVVMFALGEVIGQYVQTGKQISIAFVMLICFACILYYSETQRRLVGARFLKWFLVIGVPIGFLHNYMFSGSKQLERHRMPEGVTTVSVLVQITELSGMEKGMHATVDIKECESREVRLALGRRLQVYLPDTYDWTEDSYMQAPQIGDLILISGCVELIAPPENPGEFDRRQYYLSRGIRYEMKKTTSAKLIKRPQISYKRSVQKLRSYLRDVLYMACDEETAGLYTGILLGDKSGISEETKTLFLMAGIAHILSISALHISLVAMSVYRLLRRLGVRIASTACASGILILVYGSLTNWSFSAIRAGIMLLLVLLGELLGRKTDLLTGASISLFIMLLAEPERIRDGGVQIGFSSIVAIAVAQEILKHMRKHKSLSLVWKRHKWMYRIIAAVITSLTIFFLTVPVLTRLYFFVSPYSPILNLFVVPLMTPVVILGLLGMVLSLVNSSAGGALLYVGGLILKLFRRGCMRVQKLPFCSIGTGKPALEEAICYYLAFVLLMFLLSGWFQGWFQGWLRKKLYVRFHKWYTAKTWGEIMIALSCVYLLVCGFGIGMLHRAYLCEEVVFLSVGQGDGVLIRTGEGINLVIDGGSSTRKNIGENVLKPSIKSLAMHDVDYWFVSHADEDHTSGLLEILEQGSLSGIKIETIVVAEAARDDPMMNELICKAKQAGVHICYMQIGDCFVQENVFKITCLGPDAEGGKNIGIENQIVIDRNDQSLCLLYASNNFEILFTGDAGAEEMVRVMEKLAISDDTTSSLNRATKPLRIIKVPHHGSRYSYVDGMYAGFDYSVVSCGAKNMYGHPHTEVVEGIEAAGGIVVRTDECGAIEIRAQ